MRILYNILVFLFLTTVFYSCKKDIGNYDYTAVNAARTDTTSLATVYNIEQYGNLTISPKINYTGDTSKLSFEWLAYAKSLSSFQVGPPISIFKGSKLNTSIAIAPGNYYLELKITDKSNGLVTTSRTLLNVLATMETGWLVLHSLNGESDVDFIASKNLSTVGIEKRITNLFQTLQGGRMKGEGQMIGYARRSNSAFNFITVGTDQSIKRLNGFSFALLGQDNALFRRPLTATNFQVHLANASNELLINNGILYGLPWSIVQDALYNAPFNGDYSLAPFIVFADYSPFGALVYDQKYRRFMYTTQALANLTLTPMKTAAISSPVQAFDPSNVNKDMLFMDRGYQKNAYAFFRDRDGSGTYLYILDQSKPDAGNLALAAYNMTALPEIATAKFFQVGDLGNVALYATDKTVYRYDYSGSKLATVAFNGISSAETITKMKIFKPQLDMGGGSAEFTATDNAVLYLATWDGTQGKLYELSLNVASGVINPTPLKVYTGFGKIKNMVAKFRGTGL